MITGWHWYWGDGNDTAYSTYAPTVQHVYAGPGTFNVTLVVTTLVNMIEWTDTATRQVTVRPSPDALFSNSNVCLNQLTLFEDESQPNGVQIISWNWTFGDPLSGNKDTSSLQDPSHRYLVSGTYPVTLTVMNQFGCVDSLIKPVRVYANPVAAFSNSLVCEGNPTYFYDSSFVGDTLISYWLWHFGDHNAGGAVSLLEDPVHRYAEAGNYIVTLMVRDYNGCYDTVDSTITVNPSPVSAFSLEEDLGGKPGRLQLYNHSVGAEYFFWDFGNGRTSEEENPVVTYSEDGTYTITLITENEFGCMDTTIYNYGLLFRGLYVPNAFAPTNDNIGSQLFKPIGMNLKEYHVQVFNLWNERIWESSALDSEGRPVEGWDGKYKGQLCPSGSYMWRIDAVFIDGTIWEGSDVGTGQSSNYGLVTLVR
jgi:PKD repeat protein